MRRGGMKVKSTEAHLNFWGSTVPWKALFPGCFVHVKCHIATKNAQCLCSIKTHSKTSRVTFDWTLSHWPERNSEKGTRVVRNCRQALPPWVWRNLLFSHLYCLPTQITSNSEAKENKPLVNKPYPAANGVFFFKLFFPSVQGVGRFKSTKILEQLSPTAAWILVPYVARVRSLEGAGGVGICFWASALCQTSLPFSCNLKHYNKLPWGQGTRGAMHSSDR